MNPPPASADPVEESSMLSESAYEVINNTDTESQDGFPAESICSSDYLQSDDVHSLIGTEHTNDDDDEDDRNSHASEDMAYSHIQDAREEHTGGNEGNDTDSDSDAEEEPLSKFPDFPTHLDSSQLEDVAASAATYRLEKGENDDEDEERRSSIHYAEESLKMPSAMPPNPPDLKKAWPWLGFESKQELLNYVVQGSYSLVHGLAVVGLVSICAFLLRDRLIPATSTTGVVTTQPVVPVVHTTMVSVTTSTIIINYTSTKTVIVSETKTTSVSPNTSSTLLLPSPPTRPSEKTDGKGICSAELQSPREILVKMPQTTKLSWLAKDSISIEVARGQDSIKAKFSSVDDGILIEIPKKDAYGVLNVSVITTRKPKVNETFEVDLGKSIFDQAVDFAQDIADVVSDSLKEAGEFVKQHGLPDARKWAGDLGNQAQDAVSHSRKFVEGYLGTLNEQIREAWRETKSVTDPALLKAEWDRRVLEAQDDAKIALLRAQISANLLWLKLQGKSKEHDEYLHHARRFMRSKTDDVQWAREFRSRVWRKGRREGSRCKDRRGSGYGRWAQECIHEV